MKECGGYGTFARSLNTSHHSCAHKSRAVLLTTQQLVLHMPCAGVRAHALCISIQSIFSHLFQPNIYVQQLRLKNASNKIRLTKNQATVVSFRSRRWQCVSAWTTGHLQGCSASYDHACFTEGSSLYIGHPKKGHIRPLSRQCTPA